MRVLLMMGWLAMLPSVALAQDDGAAAGRGLGASMLAASESPAGSQRPLMRPASRPQPRCCNHKGALIGFTIGAVIGIAAVHAVCDAGNCAKTYVQGIAVFGAVGAVLGAVAPQTRAPAGFPVSKHLNVSPVASRDWRGGAVSLRF
jgi:hypothetical protein